MPHTSSQRPALCIMFVLISCSSLQFGAAFAVTLFPPDRRRYDLDNRLKAVLDSLTEASVWEDDRHVKIIHLEEGGIVKGGACRVCIAPAPDQVALLDAYGQGGE